MALSKDVDSSIICLPLGGIIRDGDSSEIIIKHLLQHDALNLKPEFAFTYRLNELLKSKGIHWEKDPIIAILYNSKTKILTLMRM